ncbi:hypothetical protein NL676_010451 [Syzygium grande]|nr:hypothetical protein NL676_010451 [Syzygium grande]
MRVDRSKHARLARTPLDPIHQRLTTFSLLSSPSLSRSAISESEESIRLQPRSGSVDDLDETDLISTKRKERVI